MNEKMEIVKTKALKFKNHVVRQKYAYFWFAAATAASVTVVRNQRTFNQFLAEKGIDPNELAQFYSNGELTS